MIQFVVGAAAGYVFGTKAGRKRYHQIKGAYEKAVNSPVTKSAVKSARKAVANRLWLVQGYVDDIPSRQRRLRPSKPSVSAA